MHLCCNIDPESLLEYGEEVLVERFGVVSMPNQVTGRCYGCRRPLEPQTSSRIYRGIQDIAAHKCTLQLVI